MPGDMIETLASSELLAQTRARWLVTGAAGFIGSHLVRHLLRGGQQVVGLDDFSTGKRRNLEAVTAGLDAEACDRFRFVEGDIRDGPLVAGTMRGVEHVLHQAALGSVPRSIETPMLTFGANAEGFLTVLTAAKEAGVKSFVYASSSSVYGDSPILPKTEPVVGQPLSPYAATKATNEMFASVYSRCYRMPIVGLRYFNVFGARQDPDGAYAAVIPRWVSALLRGQPVRINGDGETSRDFCYVDNVVQANLRAALAWKGRDDHAVFNVACGERTTLNELFGLIVSGLGDRIGADPKPVYGDFRPGDVRHSLASIEKAARELGYLPTHSLRQGLSIALDWYVANAG